MEFMGYKIKFGIEATTKTGVLKKIKEVEELNGGDVEYIEAILEVVPELLLVGLQKNHNDEFGYDYDSNEGKETAISKVYGLIDDYVDQDDSSLRELFIDLTKEVMRNGFFKKEMAQIEKNEKKKPVKVVK